MIAMVFSFFFPFFLIMILLQMIARWIGLLAFISFMGVLVWQGAWMGVNSLMMNEKMAGAFRVPLYPFKLLIPLAALLLFFQSLAVFFRERPKRKRKDQVDPENAQGASPQEEN